MIAKNGLVLLMAFGSALAAGFTSPERPREAPVVLLVRHAEKAAAPSNDPPLNEQGLKRAAALSHVLERSGVKAILVSQYARTRQTAEPTAKALNVPIIALDGADTDAVANKVRGDYSGQTVLIVGHSNTIPQIIAALGGEAPTIGDSDYDDLFVLYPPENGPARMLSLQYGSPTP